MKTIKNIGAVALMCLFLFSGYAFIQKENKGKNESYQDKGKNDDNHKGHNHDKGKGHGNDQGKGNDKDKDKDKEGKSNIDKAKDKANDVMGRGNDNNENGNEGRGKKRGDREKITICHKASKHPVTITVSDRAWPAHEAHGDVRGECPVEKTKTDGSEKDDDKILEKRTKVYNKVAEAEEVIIDSEDVLSAAKERMRRTVESIEAARLAKSATEEELKAREDKVARVGSLIKEVEDLVNVTREKLRVNVDLIEVDVTADAK